MPCPCSSTSHGRLRSYNGASRPPAERQTRSARDGTSTHACLVFFQKRVPLLLRGDARAIHGLTCEVHGDEHLAVCSRPGSTPASPCAWTRVNGLTGGFRVKLARKRKTSTTDLLVAKLRKRICCPALAKLGYRTDRGVSTKLTYSLGSMFLDVPHGALWVDVFF